MQVRRARMPAARCPRMIRGWAGHRRCGSVQLQPAAILTIATLPPSLLLAPAVISNTPLALRAVLMDWRDRCSERQRRQLQQRDEAARPRTSRWWQGRAAAAAGQQQGRR